MTALQGREWPGVVFFYFSLNRLGEEVTPLQFLQWSGKYRPLLHATLQFLQQNHLKQPNSTEYRLILLHFCSRITSLPLNHPYLLQKVQWKLLG